MELNEGKAVKGGLNRKPKTKRPSPPKGQGGRYPKPIWAEVKVKKPFCPRCYRAMRELTNPDEKTMFDYQCTNPACGYAC